MDDNLETAKLQRKVGMTHHKPVKPTRYHISHLLVFARPYWWQIASVMLVSALLSVITLTYPALVGSAIDSVIVGKNMAALPGIISLVIGLVLVQALLSFWQITGTRS